ncbi:MAG: TlpA disulfide reductase family protein [Bacteroidales bacterium]|nr:TlpA disulfide reductase family protein [Bacteroidales bacterium]
MKKGFVIVFLVLFSFLLSAQGVEEICIGVNEYAKNLRSAYYEAEISFNSKEDTLSYLHKVSFQKNKHKNKIFAKFNTQIYSGGELIKQVFCDNNQFTFVDFYENIAEQYEKEDYKIFISQLDTNLIPAFVFNKPVFNLKAIEKGDVQITRGKDTIINDFEVFCLNEVSANKTFFIRKQDFLPIAQRTDSFFLTLTRIDENAAYHDSRFVFDDKNTGIHLRYKSLSALKKQWKEQEINQSSFAYNSEALNFKVTDLQERIFELEQNKGKVIALVFFYNNCSPCIPMLDDLQEIYSQFKDRGVEVVALNPVDTKMEKEQMLSFVKDHNINYYVAQIPKYTVEEMYLVRYFPTIFIIDKKGRVVFSHQGYNTLFKDKISKVVNRKLKF